MKRVYITGVECSGKTTLASALGNALNLPVIPEFSRCYLTLTKGSYQLADLEVMAATQKSMQECHLGLDTAAIVCDTGPLVMSIWAQVVFDTDTAGIREFLRIRPDIVLIGKPDFVWEEDPLRENPHDRLQLHQLYLSTLRKLSWPYFELSGGQTTRLSKAIQLVKDVLPL